MDDDKIYPRYQVGDFVQCWYFCYQSYFHYPMSPYGDDDDEGMPFHGIIVDVDYAEYDCEYNVEIIYVIFCTDGSYRFFTEDEVHKIC